MRHLGLFEGIGGFSLAARWVGWETVAWCEWNEFGQRVLKHHFPEAIGHGDITKTDFTIYANTIDIITGGFPCQPFSLAGKRQGTKDDRHLWPEMLRAIREVRPTWIVGENVFGIVNWSGGLVFEQVQIDLENEGYEVQSVILPACAKDAPHRRDRIWFIAYRSGNGYQSGGFGEDRQKTRESQTEQDQRQRIWDDDRGISEQEIIANTGGEQLHIRSQNSISKDREENRTRVDNWDKRYGNIRDASNTESKRHEPLNKDRATFVSAQEGSPIHGRGGDRNDKPRDWQNFPTQSPICGGNDGIPERLDFDTVFEGIEKPRKPITYAKWRNESIKAYGNAIVPQVAYEIFKAINKFNDHDHQRKEQSI